MKRLEYSDHKSNKFWEARQVGSDVELRWGRIGTDGQTKTKEFASEDAAEKYVDKQVRSKVKKGYVVVEGEASAEPSPVPVAVTETVAESDSRGASGSSLPVSSNAVAGDEPTHSEPAPCATHDLESSVAWTPALRRKARPRVNERALAKPKKTPEASWKACFSECGDHIDLYVVRSERLDGVVKELRRLAREPNGPTQDISLETAAALIARHVDRDLLDYLVARQGLTFAVRALEGSLHCTRTFAQDRKRMVWHLRWRSPRHYEGMSFASAPWKALRMHLAEADPADYRAARDEAEQLRDGAHFVARAHLATLFPREQAWAEADAREWLKAGPVLFAPGEQRTDDQQDRSQCFWHGWPLWTAVRDPDLLDRFSARLKEFEKTGHKESISMILDGWPMPLLDHLGPPAARSLAAMARHLYYAAGKKQAAEALAAIRGREAAELMVDLVDHKTAGKFVRAGLQEMPELALELLESSGKRSTSVKAFTDALARQQAAATGGAVDDAETCAPERVPPALTVPPWAKRPRRKRAAVEGLDIPTDGERVAWIGREAEKLRGYCYEKPPMSDRADARWIRDIENDIDGYGSCGLSSLDRLSQRAALQVWNTQPGKVWYADDDRVLQMLRRFGPDGIPGFIACAKSKPTRAYPVLARIVSPRIALTMAEGLAIPAGRGLVGQWLIDHARIAATGLIPAALARKGKQRDLAARTLRLLAFHGHDGDVLSAADGYGDEARSAVEEVLAGDPSTDGPPRAPKLPPWCLPDALPAPELKDAGGALPRAVLPTLVQLLASQGDRLLTPALAQVREACTLDSLERFAWALLEQWRGAGAKTASDWALTALAHIHTDETPVKLVAYVGKWPGERAHPRAITGLGVLRAMDTDPALQAVQHLAETSRFQALRAAARECLDQVAKERGESPDDLAERLIPDLGLDANGERPLELSGNSYTASFDGALKPFLLDENGKKRANPTKSDPAWTAYKKAARPVLKLLVRRMEGAMSTGKRYTADGFRSQVLGHGLKVLFARRLVWGAWAEGNWRPDVTFLPDGDGNLVDSAGEPVALDDALGIGICHPLDIQFELDAWRDRGLAQPFAQLDREVFTPAGAELTSETLDRLGEERVNGRKVLALLRSGTWIDEHVEGEISRPLAHGYRALVSLEFKPFVLHETDTRVYAAHLWGPDGRARVADLPPVAFSELVRDLESLR